MKPLNRKERILKLIVEEFVKTAEPVGSSTLLNQYDLPFSSATIRNEMADLENMGYLEKTHTSSGRVPSAKGYRYYVDHLREEIEDNDIKHQIQSLFEVNRSIGIEEAIKHSCEIISQLTSLTSVVLGPDAHTEKMQKIQLVPIDDTSAVAIFITDRGHVEHKTIAIPKDVTFNNLQTCVNILNDRIVGTPVAEVVAKVDSIKPILAERVEHFELVFRSFVEAFLKFTYERVSVFGRSNLFEHKEFTNDLEKLKKFVDLLDRDDLWKQIGTDEGIRVKIGAENAMTELDDVSIVTADIKVSPHQKGTVALIGPTRMDYQKVLSAVEYLQEQLNMFFNDDSNDKEE